MAALTEPTRPAWRVTTEDMRLAAAHLRDDNHHILVEEVNRDVAAFLDDLADLGVDMVAKRQLPIERKS